MSVMHVGNFYLYGLNQFNNCVVHFFFHLGKKQSFTNITTEIAEKTT